MTTAIDYPNAEPHLGHAYEKLLADFIARYHRQKGEDVFYQTGTDEHGIKIYQTAQEEGLTAKQLVDRNVKKFKEFYKFLNIDYDQFIRTTDQKLHWPGVEKIWKLLKKNEDLYKKAYEGRYCVGCESFKTDKELVKGHCQFHPGKELKIIKEENYFFRLSKYKAQLKKIIKSDEYHVRPKSIKNEILSFLSGDVQDISFSREKNRLPWGIPVPGDKEQVMYVWADALSNYITGIGYGWDARNFKKWWPANAHLIGKDISRFHAVYWPAMLLSAGIDLPKELLVHGFINDAKGRKMSKTLGNVIVPVEQVEKYGVSSLRYYLLRGLPSNQDGNYSEEDLVARHNADLVNNLGNLLNRTVTLIDRTGGKVPKGTFDKKLKKRLETTYSKLQNCVNNFDFHHGVAEIWGFASAVNEYIQDKKPWELSGRALDDVLYSLAEGLKELSALVHPVIPSKAEEIAKQLGLKTVPKFNSAPIKAGTKVKKSDHLFKRI